MKIVRWVFYLMLSGCGTWVPVGGNYVSGTDFFEVDLPIGWRRVYSTRDGLTITRDGLSLQTVRIVREPIGMELPFTKLQLVKGMLPQEVAEIIIGNIRSNQNISNFQLGENQPNSVGGYPGFKITYSFQTKDNLRKQGVYYGVLVDQWLYRILLEAPSRHYFPRDVLVLENIRDTFKITLR
jgi:hypothetical protein